MANYVASRVTPKQLPLPAHATTLDYLSGEGTQVHLGAASQADAARTLQTVQAVLVDVLGTFVLPDQPLMQVRSTAQSHDLQADAHVDRAEMA